MHIPMDFKTIQRASLAVGVVGLVFSCSMTYAFGSTMSTKHAVMLCLFTVFAAIAFPAKRFIEDQGALNIAKWVGRAGCLFLALEFYSHVGYTVGMRNKASVEASVQTVAYDNTQKALKSEETNLEFWRSQLKELTEQNAWTATVTAEGLRAQMAVADKKITDEGKRGGCKSKCLKLMEEKAGLEERIATAEKVDDLTKRIEATQRVLDGKTEKAVTTERGFSAAAAQTDWMSKVYLLATGTEAEKALSPDDVTLTVTDIVIGLFIALGATALPTSALYVAFFGVKQDAAPADVWKRHAERDDSKPAKAGDTFIKLEGGIKELQTKLAELHRNRGFAAA